MRWKQIQDRDTRIRSRFLLFPKAIGGEVRWLERATYEQKRVVLLDLAWWDDIRWIDGGDK